MIKREIQNGYGYGKKSIEGMELIIKHKKTAVKQLKTLYKKLRHHIL